MEVRYQINDTGKSILAHAHVKTDDLLVNDYCIYLGGDIDEQNRIHKHHPEYIKDKRILRYQSSGEFIEAFCEGLITHEVIHLVIFDLTRELEITRDFDTIDKKDQICAPDFWSSEL